MMWKAHERILSRVKTLVPAVKSVGADDQTSVFVNVEGDGSVAVVTNITVQNVFTEGDFAVVSAADGAEAEVSSLTVNDIQILDVPTENMTAVVRAVDDTSNATVQRFNTKNVDIGEGAIFRAHDGGILDLGTADLQETVIDEDGYFLDADTAASQINVANVSSSGSQFPAVPNSATTDATNTDIRFVSVDQPAAAGQVQGANIIWPGMTVVPL